MFDTLKVPALFKYIFEEADPFRYISIYPSLFMSAKSILPTPPTCWAIESGNVTRLDWENMEITPSVFMPNTSKKIPNLVESYPLRIMSLILSLFTSVISILFDNDWGKAKS